MTDGFHGHPCWYELTVPDPVAAGKFYASVIGWSMSKAPMEGFDYFLASSDDAMIAGIVAPQDAGLPASWCLYVAVDDCDTTAQAMVAQGAQLRVPPSDIPGTGRFALLTDPMGADFGLLQPLPGGTGGAFGQKPGQAGWNELTSKDPAAAMAFYARHFGWQPSTAMDMGPVGTYQLFALGGADIGGIMGLSPLGTPGLWLPYFNVTSIDAASDAIPAAGGSVTHGPTEVPGGMWVLQGVDPQGAAFAVTGPR